MPQITRQVQVESSADTLGKAVVDIVAAAKKAVANGSNTMEEVVQIVSAAVPDLIAAVSAVPQVPGDVAESKVAFVQGLELRLAEVVALFV